MRSLTLVVVEIVVVVVVAIVVVVVHTLMGVVVVDVVVVDAFVVAIFVVFLLGAVLVVVYYMYSKEGPYEYTCGSTRLCILKFTHDGFQAFGQTWGAS